MKTLFEIKDNLKYYGLDRVTCFEHPIAVVLESYHDGYGSYSYMITKTFQAYHIQDVENNEELVINFWKNYLGVDVISFDLSENVLDDIKQYIDDDIPVLIFGNLIELFYSNNYKLKNWEHLFLFVGYDEVRRLLMIQDDGHLKGTPSYELFCLPEEVIKNIISKDSFFRSNKNGYILKKNDKFASKTEKEILLYLLETFALAIKSKRYSESNIISRLCEMVDKQECESERMSYIINNMKLYFINTVKFKDVFIEELLSHMHKFNYPTGQAEELRNIKNELSYVWEKYTSSTLKKFLKNKKDIDHSIPNEINLCEQKLYKKIEDCIEYLKKYKNSELPGDCKIDYLTENNEDNLIHMDGDKIIFEFNNNKIYNTWTEDYCPKVYLGDKKYNLNKKYIIYATICIEPEYLETKFEAGIFMRFDKSDMYFGGIDVNNKLVFDCIGKSNMDIEYAFPHKITLFIECSDKVAEFGFMDGNNRIIKLHRAIEIDDCIEFGIACKTWGTGKRLKVCFEDYEFQEL